MQATFEDYREEFRDFAARTDEDIKEQERTREKRIYP